MTTCCTRVRCLANVSGPPRTEPLIDGRRLSPRLLVGSHFAFPAHWQVALRVLTSLQEKELQIQYTGTHADPPDLSIISHKSRRARRRQQMTMLLLELVFTVLPHPVPGYKRTVEVWALSRKAKYEFEAIIVIFMLGR